MTLKIVPLEIKTDPESVLLCHRGGGEVLTDAPGDNRRLIPNVLNKKTRMNDDQTENRDATESGAATGQWSVWRQGDDGNRFLMAEGLSEAVARQMVAEFESRGHKQLYQASRMR